MQISSRISNLHIPPSRYLTSQLKNICVNYTNERGRHTERHIQTDREKHGEREERETEFGGREKREEAEIDRQAGGQNEGNTE